MENKRKILIIGSGATAFATAAYLTHNGCSVTLCDMPDYQVAYEPIRNQGGIMLRGNSGCVGLYMPDSIGGSIEVAMKSAVAVLICVPADRHEEIAQWCAPFVTAEHSIMLVPGNAGSILIKRIFQAKAVPGDAIIGEMSDNLWACRSTKPGEVLVALPLKSKRVSAYPSKETDKLIHAFSSFFELEPATNIIESTLNSPNVVTHVVGSILNAVQIEKMGEEFAFFQHGLSPAVITCTQAVEDERNRVLQQLGLRVYNKTTDLSKHLLEGTGCIEFELFYQLDGPGSLNHRYISEDAQCGMALMVSIAKQYNISCPISMAALTFAGYFHNVDYLATGRTLERLGLIDISTI